MTQHNPNNDPALTKNGIILTQQFLSSLRNSHVRKSAVTKKVTKGGINTGLLPNTTVNETKADFFKHAKYNVKHPAGHKVP